MKILLLVILMLPGFCVSASAQGGDEIYKQVAVKPVYTPLRTLCRSRPEI